MFSPNYGFRPRTRLEMIQTAFQMWKNLTGSSDSFTEFQGTNIHLLLHVFLEYLENIEEQICDLHIKQFAYWKEHLLTIDGSFGSSVEGWIRTFSPLCHGVDLISQEEDASLKPGEITIYFDDLIENEKALKEAFMRCKNIAEPTPKGDHSIQILYSNGQIRSYKYYNLEPKNYTKINVQITVTYQKRSLQYKDSDFEQHIRAKFTKTNRINLGFYPETYCDVSAFPGVADVILKTKLDTDDAWIAGIRPITLGHKYIINRVEMAS